MKKIIIWNFFFIVLCAACGESITEEQKVQMNYEKTTDSIIKATKIKADTIKMSKEEILKSLQ